MINRDLSEFVTGILEFLDHFKANCPGFTFKANLVKYLPTNQAKVTINIF